MRFRITDGRRIFPGKFFGLMLLDFKRLTQINFRFLLVQNYGDTSFLDWRGPNLYRSVPSGFFVIGTIAKMAYEMLCMRMPFLRPFGLRILLVSRDENAERSIPGAVGNPPEHRSQHHFALPISGWGPSMRARWIVMLNLLVVPVGMFVMGQTNVSRLIVTASTWPR
jgi:hypothetical protein